MIYIVPTRLVLHYTNIILFEEELLQRELTILQISHTRTILDESLLP